MGECLVARGLRHVVLGQKSGSKRAALGAHQRVSLMIQVGAVIFWEFHITLFAEQLGLTHVHTNPFWNLH